MTPRRKVALGIGLGVTAVLVIIAIVVAVIMTRKSDSDSSDDPWVTNYKLPEKVIPGHYDIVLHPNLDKGTFTGSETIDLELLESRNYLVIHGKYLDIKNVSLRERDSDTQLLLEPAFEVPKNEWWVLKTADKIIPKGHYKLHLDFSGSLSKSIVGFYWSHYKNAAGDKRVIATSKFEPTYARLAFPCFDEPAMKATFSVRLVRPSKGYIALSNTNVMSEVANQPSPGLTTVQFTPTVKMSTYLAVFIVCDFVHQKDEVSTEDKVPVKVYAREEQINNTKIALDVAVNATNYFTKFFGINYPMPKVDLIAIPDFVSGAMENWGLITFRETSLLFDPQQNSPANQYSVSSTVSHELAHMWFGNLVTMKWWSDLWLNEGFATFMSYKALDHIHPEWDAMTLFLNSDLHSVLKLDAALSSHPVLQVVGHPDQITEIFDTISYNKGSSVIRMLEAFMGESNFSKGLHDYLVKHQYGNAETKDLWNALQTYAPTGVDVGHVMDTWTRQMGLPLVTVKKSSDGEYILTQKRFLADPDATYDPSQSLYGYKWEIPVTFVTSENETSSESLWLYSNKENLSIKVRPNTKWIKINNKQVNYYRVMYEEENWNALTSALRQNVEVLLPADRAHLINDAFNLADASALNYNVALNLTRYLVNENHYSPWTTASGLLHTLSKRLSDSEYLRKYVHKVIEKIYSSLGWTVGTNDSHLQRRLRGVIIDLACYMKQDTALKQAHSIFKNWLDGGEKPHQDLRSIVYEFGMANSYSEDEWNALLDKYMTETNTQEKAKLMHSLASTPDEKLLKKYLDIAKNESIIRSQDYFTVLSDISNNPASNKLVWDFYRENWDYLVKRFSLNDRTFGRFIITVTSQFDSNEQLLEVIEFFAKYPDAGAGVTARKQALEGIGNNIKWKSTHSSTVSEWFRNASS